MAAQINSKLKEFCNENQLSDYNDLKKLRGILDSHHDFFKCKKSIDIDSYSRETENVYFDKYHFTSLLHSYDYDDSLKNNIITSFRLHRTQTYQELYTGGISSLEDDFVSICEEKVDIKPTDILDGQLKTLDDLYAAFGNPDELHIMVDTSKRVLKLPLGGSKKPLYYVMNSAIVNDPAPKLTEKKLTSKNSNNIEFENRTKESYTIEGIDGPYQEVRLSEVSEDGQFFNINVNLFPSKNNLTTKDNEVVNVTMNRGSKHANCISILTKRMENKRPTSKDKEKFIMDNFDKEKFIMDNFDKEQLEILAKLNYAGFLTRKRFGDELQAEVCKQLYNNSNISDNKIYAIVTIDRMLYAHCLLIGCPCILDMGTGKNYKIYKGDNSIKNGTTITINNSISGGAGQRADGGDENQHQDGDEDLLLKEFLLTDPYAAMLYLTMNKQHDDLDDYYSHAITSVPNDIPITKDSIITPWKNDYFLSKSYNSNNNQIQYTTDPTYSSYKYHPYVSNDNMDNLLIGNSTTHIVKRNPSGKFVDLVDNSLIIDLITLEAQQKLFNDIEVRLFPDFQDVMNNAQVGGAPSKNKVKDLLEYIYGILHIYELNTICDHEVHAIDYFDNRDSFKLISDKLELRIFLKLLLDKKMTDIEISSGSNIVYMFIDMLRLIDNETSNIILYDLFSHIDYVSDCGIKMKVYDYEFDNKYRERIDINDFIMKQLKEMIDETEQYIREEPCQALIKDPYNSDNIEFINTYNLSFGGYSKAFQEVKKQILPQINKKTLLPIQVPSPIQVQPRIPVPVMGGKNITKKKTHLKKKKPHKSLRKGIKIKKNKTINKKKVKSRKKNNKK